MPCPCRRLTVRYACRHKEREFYKCWRYQFRRDYSCLGAFVSNCETEQMRIVVPRVCNKCLEYFLGAFDKESAYYVSKRFLEFKANNGLSKEVINPETINLAAYITSAELATLRACTPPSSGQPFRPRSPMRATQSRVPPPTELQQPEPVIHRNRHGDRHSSRSKTRSKSAKPSKKKPIPRKPVPSQTKISKASISKPIAHWAVPSEPNTGGSNLESFPAIPENTVVEHGSNQPIDLSDLVENEYDDYVDYGAISHGRALNRTPYQPLPMRLNHAAKAPRPQPSDSSLVKRITKLAETTEIMGYPNPEKRNLPSVPKLTKPPKVPTWRVETPHPEAPADIKGKGKQTRSQSAMLLSRPRDLSPLRRIPTPATATYIRRARASSESPMPPMDTPLRDTLQLPPLRTAALKSFRERGIPSAAFLLEENIGDKIQTVPSSPAVLVSVNTPSPSYSCAVQSCYCTPDEADNQVCPSCRERRRLERELQMKWI
ncbi:hypothetical protein F4781DRAFT_352831 [Annulohypoxylon bovei var. microspora]|nr:hypothetical protein F4781DRAFT_352831 [Annulohypoxylon bovei var. microspora]